MRPEVLREPDSTCDTTNRDAGVLHDPATKYAIMRDPILTNKWHKPPPIMCSLSRQIDTEPATFASSFDALSPSN
jgi:hypothetical protein